MKSESWNVIHSMNYPECMYLPFRNEQPSVQGTGRSSHGHWKSLTNIRLAYNIIFLEKFVLCKFPHLVPTLFILGGIYHSLLVCTDILMLLRSHNDFVIHLVCVSFTYRASWVCLRREGDQICGFRVQLKLLLDDRAAKTVSPSSYLQKFLGGMQN